MIAYCPTTFYIFSPQLFNFLHFLFLMTDRTQSGGDTYFCIDTLLLDTEQDFSILTPLGKESNTKYVSVLITSRVVLFVTVAMIVITINSVVFVVGIMIINVTLMFPIFLILFHFLFSLIRY